MLTSQGFIALKGAASVILSDYIMLLVVLTQTFSTVEDLERNDGTVDRPYFMPERLMATLKKSNQSPGVSRVFKVAPKEAES